jgi:hypothetical protein
MSSAAASSGPESLEVLATVSPGELADGVRAATAHIYVCAQAWRSSSAWRGDKLQRKVYDCVVAAVAELDTVPAARTYRDVDRTVDVVARILNAWWPDAPGVQRDLHDAVDRLRQVAMHRVAWVRQARGMLGQPW